MRAISLTQPWCGLVAAGIKRIENRSTPIIAPRNFHEPVGLHATREIDETVYKRLEEIAPELVPYGQTKAAWAALSRITSAVIGIATPVRVIKATGWDEKAERFTYSREDLDFIGDQARWLFGRYGYVFENCAPIKSPVPTRGWQGLWSMPRDVEAKVREQLKVAA